MKLLFAPDSFKGSLTALEITKILRAASTRHFPDASTVSVPVADGGEGTVEALVQATGGHYLCASVTGPLMTPAAARYGILGDGETAVIEIAQTSGLPLVPPEKRDPRRTTTLGAGELIRIALANGARKLLIGIGGSATNDGGMGMLQALGARFLDARGEALAPVGGSLARVAAVDLSGLAKELRNADITVICDVTNPLLGERGATFIYGPQKGATPGIRDELESGMANYAAVMAKVLGRDIAAFPGAGAAGGLGAALGGVLGAKLKSGIDAVLDAVRFDELLEGVSLVVTGEGRIDGQSVRFGKVPVGVAKRCRARGIPVAVIAGGIGEGASGLYELCESVIFSTAPGPITLEKSMADAETLFADAADRLFRAIKIGMRLK